MVGSFGLMCWCCVGGVVGVMGSVSAGAGAGVGDHSGALGENPDAAGRGDRDLCAGEPTGLAVSDERVPGQQAIDHVWVTGQLCHEAVVGPVEVAPGVVAATS